MELNNVCSCIFSVCLLLAHESKPFECFNIAAVAVCESTQDIFIEKLVSEWYLSIFISAWHFNCIFFFLTVFAPIHVSFRLSVKLSLLCLFFRNPLLSNEEQSFSQHQAVIQPQTYSPCLFDTHIRP